jgi:hypothetical protein
MFKKLLDSVHFIKDKIRVFRMRRQRKKSLRTLKKVTSVLPKEEKEIINEMIIQIENEDHKGFSETARSLQSDKERNSSSIEMQTALDTIEVIANSISNGKHYEAFNILELHNELKDLNLRSKKIEEKFLSLPAFGKIEDQVIDQLLKDIITLQKRYEEESTLEFNTEQFDDIDKLDRKISEWIDRRSLVEQYRDKVRNQKEHELSVIKLCNIIDDQINKKNFDSARDNINRARALIKKNDSENILKKVRKAENKFKEAFEKFRQAEIDRITKENLRKAEEERLRIEEEERIVEEQKRALEQQKEDALIRQERIERKYYEPKPDWDEIEQYLIENGIIELYHFTDRGNIRSIINQGGLYSWFSCDIKGIDIPRPGGNQSSRAMDSEKNLHDYVRLSFNATHPMLYVCKDEHRIYNPVILRINPLVCSWKNTKFSNSNANKRDAQFGPSMDDLKKINLKYATYEGYASRDEPEKHKFKQAEVMVLKHIPLKYINNIDDFR